MNTIHRVASSSRLLRSPPSPPSSSSRRLRSRSPPVTRSRSARYYARYAHDLQMDGRADLRFTVTGVQFHDIDPHTPLRTLARGHECICTRCGLPRFSDERWCEAKGNENGQCDMVYMHGCDRDEPMRGAMWEWFRVSTRCRLRADWYLRHCRFWIGDAVIELASTPDEMELPVTENSFTTLQYITITARPKLIFHPIRYPNLQALPAAA